MKPEKLAKLNRAKEVFSQKNLIYEELPNGQLKIDGKSYWATTEKWCDHLQGVSGKGINSFLSYLKRDGYEV